MRGLSRLSMVYQPGGRFTLQLKFLPMLALLCASIAYPKSKLISPSTAELKIDWLKTNCIQFANVKIGKAKGKVASCAVVRFDSIGIVDGKSYYAALYRFKVLHGDSNGVNAADTNTE